MEFDFDMVSVVRILLASILGGLIGLEREVHGRPAGFRTHLLVSLGSCLFALASIHFYKLYGNFSGTVPVGVDPSRIAAQVVTGIGFLGAGAIIREKASIRGLTTAACLWVAAAIGIACGVGMYATSTVVTMLALVSLLLLKKVENKLSRDTYSSVKVWSADMEGQMGRIEKLLADCQVQVMNVSIEKDMESRDIFLEFEVKYSARELACNLVNVIVATSGVKKVRLD
ncbi:MAG: putative Mg2+ transporter-C (MgtC) family [Geobacteraceae bacterium]|nr:MAG: putative Mg2+ transporter-C (MgtC) family [Geobacteraceae bacterium]